MCMCALKSVSDHDNARMVRMCLPGLGMQETCNSGTSSW